NAQFVQASLQSMVLLGREYPLVYARIKQLQGDYSQAIEDFIKFRLAENVPYANGEKKIIPKEVQDALNAYATNYLALAQLERNNLEQARDMFLMLLDLVPEPGPNQPYYNMLRWGAHTNLGRIYEALGDRRKAIAHYSQNDPTMQHIGNMLRARELVWEDPMAAPPDPLPPAPLGH
ncbi:MAG: tetratricopeptide repeat protein, partial [Isosphaeraceae bacterium]